MCSAIRNNKEYLKCVRTMVIMCEQLKDVKMYINRVLIRMVHHTTDLSKSNSSPDLACVVFYKNILKYEVLSWVIETIKQLEQQLRCLSIHAFVWQRWKQRRKEMFKYEVCKNDKSID